MKEANKNEHEAMCGNAAEEIKNRYERIKNKERKCSKTMREKAGEVLIGLRNCPNWMFRVV